MCLSIASANSENRQLVVFMFFYCAKAKCGSFHFGILDYELNIRVVYSNSLLASSVPSLTVERIEHRPNQIYYRLNNRQRLRDKNDPDDYHIQLSSMRPGRDRRRDVVSTCTSQETVSHLFAGCESRCGAISNNRWQSSCKRFCLISSIVEHSGGRRLLRGETRLRHLTANCLLIMMVTEWYNLCRVFYTGTLSIYLSCVMCNTRYPNEVFRRTLVVLP